MLANDYFKIKKTNNFHVILSVTLVVMLLLTLNIAEKDRKMSEY